MNTNIKKAVLVLAAVLLLFGGGYATGRYAAPDKVVVTEKVVTVEKQVIVTQTKTEVQVVKVADLQRDVHKVVVKNKDGSETITTDDKSKEHTDAKTNVDKATQQVKETIVYKDREVTKTVERLRPQWALSLQPGFEIGTALGLGAEPYNMLDKILPLKHVMANVTIERRLMGPLFVGAWANTHLDGGLSLRLEW